MLRKLSLAVAITTLSAGGAFAACDERMQTATADFQNYAGAAGRTQAESRPVLRNLREAASELNRQGLQASCEAVVDAMRLTIEQYRDSADASASTAENTEVSADQANARADIEARSVNVADSGMFLDTAEMIGVSVYNYQNETLGEVDSLLVPAGKGATHVIVAHGGFWSMGDTRAAVPLDAVKWDPSWEVFYTDMTEEQLEAAPKFTTVDGNWTDDENDSYYKNLLN